MYRTWPQRPLTVHQHPNIISPLATFRAADLSTGTCTNVDNVAVLPTTSVVDFRQYWQELRSCSDSRHTDRAVCLTLARLLSAALSLHELGSPTPRLVPRCVIMTVLLTGESYPLLRPSSRDPSGADNSETIVDDVAELVAIMLQLNISDCGNGMHRRKSDTSLRRSNSVEVALAISPESSYSRCLQHVVRYLCQKDGSLWDAGLRQALQLLQFTLWGPSEEEAQIIAVSDSCDAALQVWLSVTRCRLLAELAVTEGAATASQNGLELAERATFLSLATENSLLEVTKLLFT